jgi:hypothetical protein
MPTFSNRQSVAANAVVTNVMSGNQYEFLPFDAFVEFGLVAAATGLNATVTTGSDLLQSDTEVSAANRMPIYPDDFVLNDVAAAGDRLVVSFRNTTGAAIVAFTIVKITPL